MTTIILTIIGILLAAAAALMVIFYGGDAFNAGSIGAQANTYQNAGTNVISAVQLAKAEVAPSASFADLIAGDYLDEEPALPSDAVTSLSATQFTATVVSSSVANADLVCDRINANLRNGLVGDEDIATVDAKMGCVTAGTPGVPTFFANI
jgi:hypothetical protein